MSQAKVEQHKKDKANRKKIMAKERAQRIAARVCATRNYSGKSSTRRRHKKSRKTFD